MSMSSEVSHEGLEIRRNVIEPALAAEFQDEMFAYLSEIRRSRLFGEFTQPHLQPQAFSERMDEMWHYPEFSAARRVSDALEIEVDDETGHSVTVVFQPANLAQPFHKDNPTEDDQAIIFHAGNNGAFDLSRTATTEKEAEEDHQTLEFSAGDVLKQTIPYVFHRGRNRGNTPRVTAVFARLVDNYFYV